MEINILGISQAFVPGEKHHPFENILRHTSNKINFHMVYLSSVNESSDIYKRMHDYSENITYGYSIPNAIRYVSNYTKSNNIDIIHTHHPKPNLVGRCVKKLNEEVILISGLRNAYHGLSWRARAVEKYGHKLSDCNIAVSRGVERSYFGTETRFSDINNYNNRNFVIHNCIDTKKMDEELHTQSIEQSEFEDIKNSEIVVGSVGSLTEQKGYEYLLRSAKEIKNDSVKIVLVGKGPKEQELKSIADKEGVNNIIFYGHCKNVPQILKLFDIFVQPSLWEGLPKSLLEAMYAGVPCIGTNVEGIEEVLSGNTGVLVDPESPSQLACAINDLVDSKNERENYSEKGKQLIIANHSEQVLGEKYDKVYKSLLS